MQDLDITALNFARGRRGQQVSEQAELHQRDGPRQLQARRRRVFQSGGVKGRNFKREGNTNIVLYIGCYS